MTSTLCCERSSNWANAESPARRLHLARSQTPGSEVKYGLRGLWGGDCVAGGLEFGDGSLVAAFGLLVAVVVFFA